jgi:hypothetical protein
MGNHFQAGTYNEEEYRFYAENLVQLALQRNVILEAHGWKSLDMVAYDVTKTARAAAAALTAIRRASTVPSDRRGRTIGEEAATARQEAQDSSQEDQEIEGEVPMELAPALQDSVQVVDQGWSHSAEDASWDAHAAGATTEENSASVPGTPPPEASTSTPSVQTKPAMVKGLRN